jgi:hypothetical protein
MATYTVTGHPLNYADLAATPGAAIDPDLLAALQTRGVGQSVTLTLTGPLDTKSKGHGILK